MNRVLPCALLGVTLGGCYVGGGTLGSNDGAGDDFNHQEIGTDPTGLPCPVANLLATHCASCHGASPSSGTRLLSYADLAQASKSDPTKNEAQLALARMKDGTMPPSGASAPSAQEVAAFEAWVTAGQPPGSCAAPDAAARAPDQGTTKPSGLPCPVANLLGKYCLSCHGASPSSGTSLVTYADLKKASKTDPTKNEGQLALSRMKAGTMPPSGASAPSAQEVAAFEAWVTAGEPPGSCTPPDAGPLPDQGTVPPTGLPCDVANLLGKYCVSCHGASPSSGTSLVTLAELKQTSKSDPTKNEAQLALARMQAGTMPPGGATGPTVTELAAFAAWVSAGEPPGTCGSGDGGVPDPFAGPHVCSSNSYYSGGEGSTMEPGNACISCHATTSEAPRFKIAGTLYPTGHEPPRCKAVGLTAAVIAVTGATGATTLYPVNSVGNFSGTTTVALPFKAEVRMGGNTRAMATPQTNGDCNLCHTENGANGAPGRVLVP